MTEQTPHSPPRGGPLGRLPRPLRYLALAASAAVCVFFLQHEARRLFGPPDPPLLSDEPFGDSPKVAHPPETNARIPEDRPAPGGPVSGEDPRPSAGGADYTNEDLQGFLDEERDRMGIREIVPAQAKEGVLPGTEIPDRPLDPEEARSVMRRMTSQLAEINKHKQMKIPPAVALEERSSPRLLSVGDPSGPVEDAGRPALPQPQSGLSLVGRGSADVSVSPPAAIEAGPMSDREVARALSRGGRRRGRNDWSRDWSGTTTRFRGPGGAAAWNPDDWAGLWRRLDSTQALPEMDFEKEMAVSVFGPAEPRPRTVRIEKAREEGGRLLVRYRLVPPPDGPASAPSSAASSYHLVIVPRSRLPVAFEQTP